MNTETNLIKFYSPNTSSGSASRQDTSVNSGDSMAQGPENIVNEQEQNISVNQEEFVNDDLNTRFENPVENPPGDDDDDDDEPLVPEIGDDPDETEKKIPIMAS